MDTSGRMLLVSRNRLHNITNPYQGSKKKVLCVCSAGLMRSPTAAEVLNQEYGYNTRAVGIDLDHALIPIDEVTIAWADEVVFMSIEQERQANMYFKDAIANKSTQTLHIPDIYAYGDVELKELIIERYEQ